MNLQEKYMMTVQCMRLVSANYHLLRSGGVRRCADAGRRKRLRILGRWLEVIEGVVRELKRQAGKSSARLKKDRLIARTIEMSVFEQANGEKMRLYLTGPRPLNQRYVDGLMEEAVKAVLAAAVREGLLG